MRPHNARTGICWSDETVLSSCILSIFHSPSEREFVRNAIGSMHPGLSLSILQGCLLSLLLVVLTAVQTSCVDFVARGESNQKEYTVLSVANPDGG